MIDTNIVSEARKGIRANAGVVRFLRAAAASEHPVFLSAVTVGELRRGIDLVRRRGDTDQASALESWMMEVLTQFAANILPFDADAAQLWGRLRVPDPSHEIDKQIAAIALVHDLIVVTRNVQDFAATGVRVENPFG